MVSCELSPEGWLVYWVSFPRNTISSLSSSSSSSSSSSCISLSHVVFPASPPVAFCTSVPMPAERHTSLKSAIPGCRHSRLCCIALQQSSRPAASWGAGAQAKRWHQQACTGASGQGAGQAASGICWPQSGEQHCSIMSAAGHASNPCHSYRRLSPSVHD